MHDGPPVLSSPDHALLERPPSTRRARHAEAAAIDVATERGPATRSVIGVAHGTLRIVALALLTLGLFGFDLGALTYESPDEARFPLMARDVLANGHWLIPEIAGTPKLNKPPLHAWLIAVASWPGGAVTFRTAALPSVIGALGVVLITTWIGLRLFGAPAGVTAGFLTATAEGVFSLARSPIPDVTLTLAITASMCALALAEFEHRRHALVALYGFAGLGFLSKGPAGLMPLAAALAYAVVAHGLKGPRRLVSLPGMTLLALLIVPWLGLALRAGGHRFVDDVLIKDLVMKYFGADGWHWQRLYEPVRQALTLFLPWSVFVPLAVWTGAREPDPERASRVRMILVWAATVFLLVAVSEVQRARYYLPLCPPLALSVAAWHCGREHRRRAIVIARALAAIVLIALAGMEIHEVARRRSLTDVSAVAREIGAASKANVFSLDSPDVVFAYYLNRSVIPLTFYWQFEKAPKGSYLIASERAARQAPAKTRVAAARVNGRAYVVIENR